MRQSTLSLPAALAANRRPLPPPPPLPLPPGRHCLHRYHRGQTCRRSLPKKEATAAAPPAYQWQHQRENVYKSRRLDLFNLSTVLREFSDYQVVSFKKIVPFLRFTYSQMTRSTFLGGGGGASERIMTLGLATL
jgi:hypothetical protein